MAFNPFLNMGDPAPVETETLNPFMIGAENEQVVISTDNPFAASNPFADFGASMYEPNTGEIEPMDIFGTMSTNTIEITGGLDFKSSPLVTEAMDFLTDSSSQLSKPTQLNLTTTVDSSNVFSSDDETQKPRRPPLPSRPLPPETQNLILSVTDHMDFTSSHLLDRIPPTRTPSPVSIRDLHSPSPTPDPDINFVEDQSTIENTGKDIRNGLVDINQNKPMRPPPARPPPARPQPPPVPPLVSKQPPPIPQKQEPKLQDDDINLFDAPVPTLVKPTKEAILSLYSAPKEVEKQIDFLSDDNILDTMPEKDELNDATSPDTLTVRESTPLTMFSSDVIATPEHPSSNISIETISAIEPNETANLSETEKGIDDENNVFESNEGFGNYSDEPVATSASDFGTFEETVTNFKTNEAHNPFEAMDTTSYPEPVASTASIFGTNKYTNEEQKLDAFSSNIHPILKSDSGFGESIAPDTVEFPAQSDAFDAFSAKFDAFSKQDANTGGSVWGEAGEESSGTGAEGFETDETFDAFLNMQGPPPAPAATPLPVSKEDSQDSDDGNFNVYIRPKTTDSTYGGGVPALAPPPRPQVLPESPRVNPFDSQRFPETIAEAQPRIEPLDSERKKSGSDTPPTPLFDEDITQPLEDFPRVIYNGPGWEMQLRQPNKKKITGQRFWKKIFVKMAYQGDNLVVQLYNAPTDKEPFQELPLQACYSVSEIGAQQYDQFGKIFTVKLQYIFYKERPGVRPGQVTKAERITNKLSQFAAYAIQGDYQGVKEFGSDLKKLGLPVEHAPQISQLFKIGSLNYEDVKQFSVCVEEALFKLNAHRDRALTYKMEEVQITAVDELYVEQDAEGSVQKQIARVRLFFLGFLSGMPDIEVGVNDMRRQGKEVVGRHDIIPVATEEWIRVENMEFHACVQPEEFTKTQIIKFKPPDACYIELMRFRIRPPKNRELPLQLKAVMCVTGNKVELRADVLVPGFASRKLGQVPCEDVMIRFPIPECWIYLFRVEKHFRYGSVKSAHRRSGKIKGIERFLGTVETLQESLIEVTSGQAKYEHQHRSIVWRMPRLPKEGQGAYTTHNLVCRMALTSYDQIPPELAKFAYVEFTMPATQVSHMTVRSVSLQNHDSDEPPEKYVRYLARHEYVVGIEHTTGSTTAAYVAAAAVPAAQPPQPLAPVPQAPSSDSDSD